MAEISPAPLRILPASDGKPLAGVGPGIGVVFAKAYFPEAQSLLRIATAYFTPTGYKVGKPYIDSNVLIHILVRKEEGRHAQAAIIDEILEDLGQCTTEIWDTVAEIVERMKQRRCIIQEAREMQVLFHCKFYVSDNHVLWEGSANYTGDGFQVSVEQLKASRDAEEIQLFIDWYDEVVSYARDLVPDLIEILEKWLNLSSPFDIYLKTLFLLDNVPDYKVRQGAFFPTYYQKGIISRALQQVDQFGGALVIAATGLGKTVIGAEIALRLQQVNTIKRTILLLPAGVEKDWKRECKGRDVNYEPFNINILFRKASNKSHHKSTQLEELLQQADHNTLILIDEAHFLRNELLRANTKNRISLVYDRILPAARAGAKIVLLTATAYGTAHQNLNSLLYLLPWTKEDVFGTPAPWYVQTADEFASLPVVTILGLPHVLRMARDRGDVDEDNRTFIQFGGDKKYLPKSLKLYSVPYQLFLQSELQYAFDHHCFDQAKKIAHHYYGEEDTKPKTGLTDSVYNNALGAWLSSPFAMADSIEQNLVTPGREDTIEGNNQLFESEFWYESFVQQRMIDDSDSSDQDLLDTSSVVLSNKSRKYDTLLRLKLAKRKKVLESILSKLQISKDGDDKYLKLVAIIKVHCLQEKGKVIIFVERHLTALYLADILANTFDYSINIGCTIEQGTISPQLKRKVYRSEILQSFSPKSHDCKPNQEYDILICTDADGVGVNLQDANVIVNYDPPESADVQFQRVGRILRMTNDKHRSISIYTLTPSIIDSENLTSPVYNNIRKHFERLERRHQKSKRILGSTVMSKEQQIEIMLDDDIDVEQLARDGQLLSEVSDFSASPEIQHTAVLEKYRDQAGQLPDWVIMSARNYPQRKHRLFVMIKFEDKYHLLILDVKEQKLEQFGKMEILDMIACGITEDKAMVKPQTIESLANLAVQEWCASKEILINKVQKVCAMYLAPTNAATQVKDLLRQYEDKKKRRR